MVIFHVTVVATLYFSVPSCQHFISIQDPCYLANTCNHTWIAECGLKKSHMRIFLDECDRYEYNCDHNQDYIKTEMSNCTGLEENKTITKPTSTTTITPNTTILTTTDSTTSETTSASTNEASITIEAPSTTTETPATTINVTETTTVFIPTSTVSTEQTKSVVNQSTTENITTTISNDATTDFITTSPVSTVCTRPPKIKSGCNNESKVTTTESSTTKNSPTTTESPTTKYGTTTKENSTAADNTTETKKTATTGNTTNTENSTTTENITKLSATSNTNIKNATTTNSTAKMTYCNDYPKHCDRPVTWETTVKGETRDFFKILKERFGRRARFMKPTTHWPKKLGVYMNNKKKNAAFLYGNHIEKRSDS